MILYDSNVETRVAWSEWPKFQSSLSIVVSEQVWRTDRPYTCLSHCTRLSKINFNDFIL